DLPQRHGFSGGLGRPEGKRYTVDAMAHAGGRRAIIENVTEVTTAAPAMDFGASREQRIVFLGADGALFGLPEAWPTGSAVEFRFGRIGGQVTAGAMNHALPFLVVERACEGALRRFLAQDRELLRRQPFLPLRLAQHDFEGAFRSTGRAATAEQRHGHA